MNRTASFRKKGKVSIWLWLNAVDQDSMEGVDILKDLCGVGTYDLDNQEVSAVDDSFPLAPVSEIIGSLSYSSSFIDHVIERTSEKGISHAHGALAQFDFAYDPRRVGKTAASAPLYLGAFEWNDLEDDL